MPTARGSACIGCGILFLIIGIILSVGGSIFFKYDLDNILKKDISKNVLTLSPSSQFWQNWINQGGPFNVSFYAYDLLNVNEVLLGKKANFSLKGPYSYIQYEELTDIQFSPDNEEVSYNYFTYYVLNDYENEKNKVHPNTDIITNINPAFLAVLINAGSELNLLFALGVYTLDEYFIWGQQNLMNFSLAKENSFVLNSRIENVISNLQSNYNLSKEVATETFFSIWANATSPPTQYPSIDWTGLLLSDGLSASGISIESATNLLGNTDSLALLNSSQSSWSPWGWILNGNTTYTQSVASHFALTTSQMNQVVNWLSFFTTFYTTPHILEYYDLKQLSDVVYSQYASYTPLGISIAHVDPPIQYQWDHTVESAQSTVVYDSIEQMKAVFSNGPYNLRNGTNYALFLQTALSNEPNYTIFGLSFNQGQNLSNQFESYVQFSPNYLSSWMNSGKTGLFVTQSVNNWIFGCTDQLVNVLEPGSACGLQVNNTYLPGNNVVKTGKTNITNIQRYIQWHGLTEIEGIWAETVPIHGYTEYGQFKPMLEKDEVITTWDGSTLRNINFQQNGKLNVHGVPVYDYFMPNETFAASELFNQPNISGVANMTASSQGAPIYLGFFDLIGVPAKYSTDKINGLNQNLSNAITHLQVEPYLGLAMSAQKRMQINSFLSEYIVTNFLNSQYIKYNTVLNEVFYPLVQIELKAEATKAQADQIKSALFVAIYRDTFFYSFLGGGIGLAIIGIILLAVGIHQYKNRDYIAIN